MTKERYNIYLFGRKAVCPVCSGMLAAIGKNLHYTCIDCHSSFQIVDGGLTDNEVVCEKVLKEVG